jgi:uncharacterized protein YkwD
VAALSAMLLAPAAASAWCPNQEMLPTTRADMPAFERAVLCLINEERTQRGRRALERDSRLALAGAKHVEDMVERRYFAHESLGGSAPLDRIRRAGYGAKRRSWMFGEILAWGTLSRSRPAAVVENWMKSPGHRAAILEPSFSEAGPGATIGNPRRPGDAGVTVAVEFGRVL